MEDRSCKIVLVGDSKCGKTALVHRFTNDNFIQVYTPTGFERYTAEYEMANFRIHFTIWDTSGASAYDTVRPLAYQDARVFLLCFQINSPASLDNALKKWYPEIREHCATAPVVLCGCHCDTRQPDTSKQQRGFVSTEQAVSASRQLGAATYVETSSKGCERTVAEAFEVAALAALGKLNKNHLTLMLRHRNKHKKKKNLLKPHLARHKARTCVIM